MLIHTNAYPNDDTTSHYYARTFATFTLEELMNTGYRIFKVSGFNDNIDFYCIDTNCIFDFDIHGQDYKGYLIFANTNKSNDYYLYGALKLTNDPRYIGYYCNVPLFRDIGCDINELIKRLKDRYEKVVAKKKTEYKKKTNKLKISDIQTEDRENILYELAAKYKADFTNERNKDVRLDNKKYVFKLNGCVLQFMPTKIHKYDLNCWKLYWYMKFTNTTYDTYINDFNDIPTIADGFLKIASVKNLTKDYHDFT